MRTPRVAAILGAVLVLAVASQVLGSGPVSNPWLKRPGYADSGSQARVVSETASEPERTALAALAQVPTAVWLTPEALPTAQVRERVADVVAAAGNEARTPTFVVYGIPDRDCEGGHSDGGLDEASYPAWVSAIASALKPGAAVILEPDALATAPACGLTDTRTALLSEAVDRLVKARAAVYLDAGHADWVPARKMARLLRRAGVEDARGFALNVAGYGATTDQVDYAEQVRAALPDAHYVIDTGRNGNGPGDTWCNPVGRALGELPQAFQGALDAWLWVKPPGESDGTCNGGPPAGQWWSERALELAGNAGFS